MRPRLVTIPISHYGERARWALDHAEIDYDEEHHLQMFSWFWSYRSGGRKSLPILVTAEGTLTDSRDILRYASSLAKVPLYPEGVSEREDVERLEELFAGEYGVEGRRVMYEWFFRSLEAVARHNEGRAPEYECTVVRNLRGPVRLFARKYLKVSAESAARARGVVRKTLDIVAARLSDGRRYLLGDRFTAADLTFAAMSAPGILPDRYPVTLPEPEALVPDATAWVRENRDHPAGRFALRLYDERPAPRGRYRRALRVAPRVELGSAR